MRIGLAPAASSPAVNNTDIPEVHQSNLSINDARFKVIQRRKDFETGSPKSMQVPSAKTIETSQFDGASDYNTRSVLNKSVLHSKLDHKKLPMPTKKTCTDLEVDADSTKDDCADSVTSGNVSGDLNPSEKRPPKTVDESNSHSPSVTNPKAFPEDDIHEIKNSDRTVAENNQARTSDIDDTDKRNNVKSVPKDILEKSEEANISESHKFLNYQNKPRTGISTKYTEPSDLRSSFRDLPIADKQVRSAKNKVSRASFKKESVSKSHRVDVPQVKATQKKLTNEDAWMPPSDQNAPLKLKSTPPEDSHGFVISTQEMSDVDEEYALWNDAILDQLLLSGQSSEKVFLCVNPRILARVFEEAGFGWINPEQAEQQFKTAVASLYKKRVLGYSAKLRTLRRCSNGRPPDCVAFLACSVLAAYHMQSDEELSGNAYYRRLADLLMCEMQGAHPIGFDPPVFESLWAFLGNWLRETHGLQLALPRTDVGFRRFVALPLAHVPLRSLDIEKLPSFFSWAGYHPATKVRYDRLLADLKEWQRSRNLLTPTGTRALYDDRALAVTAQVGADLEAWDGSLVDTASRRSALVEIKFDIVQRKPVFFYLPRRPPGFPKVFEDCNRVFEASDEGWYDPIQIDSEDGELLRHGFEWKCHADGIDYKLRRSMAQVISFTPSSSHSGFLSNRRVLRGVRCSVLCRDEVVPIVKDYLSEVAQVSLSPVSHSLLPTGWSLFRDFSARINVEAPSGLEQLEVDPNIDLIVADGLRIGRRWAWLTGAPPRILVSGVEDHDQVTVNDVKVNVGPGGELLTDGVFLKPGDYLIKVGNLRRRIHLERPHVSIKNLTDQRESQYSGQSRRLVLPHGSWTVIGNSPDQISYTCGQSIRGTIASCQFQPSWAIQVGNGPGALVVFDVSPSPPQMFSVSGLSKRTRRQIDQWSSVVYAAHIRRPRFIALNEVFYDDEIIDIWRSYVRIAKRIKRRLKSLR